MLVFDLGTTPAVRLIFFTFSIEINATVGLKGFRRCVTGRMNGRTDGFRVDVGCCCAQKCSRKAQHRLP